MTGTEADAVRERDMRFCPVCGTSDWPSNCPTACRVGQRFRALLTEQDTLRQGLTKIARRTVGEHLSNPPIPPVDPDYPGHEDMRPPRFLVEFSRGMQEAYEDCASIARAVLAAGTGEPPLLGL